MGTKVRLDGFARAYCEQLLKVRFMEARGQAFQDFFSDIMEKRYPGDFHRVKPWGRLGDLKNDGYLVSDRTLFQVFAPSEIEAAQTVAKMEEDFEGGYANWHRHTDRWVFVTSERGGMPAPVEAKLLELNGRHPGVTAALWGFEELRRRVFELADVEIAALLGPAPSRLDVADVAYSDLAPVLEAIGARLLPTGGEIRPVPQDKLDANGLSGQVKLLLSVGSEGSGRVASFFRDHLDALKGDAVAAMFTSEYVRLRDANTPPDDIYTSLRVFAAGPLVMGPKTEAAVLALLAYLFERCDIYEPVQVRSQ